MASQRLSISTNNPKISVIMNCYNSDKYLHEAIDSVYAQTYKDWEIVFWDNASTDNSAKIARSYDEKLNYFKSEKTFPLGNARNRAIEKSRGDYIAFIDCDDLWLPDKLEKQIPLFNNKEVGLVFSDVIMFKENWASRRIYGTYKPPQGFVFRELLKTYHLSIPSVIVRKSALDNLNEWFDESLCYAEEKDLFLRIAYNNKLDYIDEPLAKYRIHSNSTTVSNRALAIKEDDIVIDKLRNLYKDDYQYEFNSMKDDNRFQDAMLVEWENGNMRQVRKLLKPHLRARKLFFLIFCLSFLPFRTFVVKLARDIRWKILP